MFWENLQLVCKAKIKFLTIYINIIFKGPDQICSFVIGDACGDVYNPYHEWEVIFPPVAKPKVEEEKIPQVNYKNLKKIDCIVLIF